MASQSCVWSDIFDDQSRANLERGLIMTGVIAFLLGVWLNLALLLTNLRSDLSYRNLAFFTVIACLRRAVSVFSYLPLFNYYERYIRLEYYNVGICCLYGGGLRSTVDIQWLICLLHFFLSFKDGDKNISCDVSGFWDSFWTVYEVECLTHVCIERYVVAKYTTRGWPIQKNHYILFQSLCLFFASLYSLPPLFGIGRFGHDFSCQSCVLDMVLPETWQRYIIVLIFLLRSVKSAGFMLTMLLWASNLELKYDHSEKLSKAKRFTKSAIVITFVNLICWLPIASLRGLVVLSYLLFGGIHIPFSASTVQFAVWTYWAAPAFTTLAMFLVDDRVHQQMLHVWKGHGKKDSVKNE